MICCTLPSKIFYVLAIILGIGGGFLIYSSLMKKDTKILNTSERIYAVLDRYRIMYDIDQRSMDLTTSTAPHQSQGVDQCIKNIAYFVTNNRPIRMLLVGFPFKSSNHEKKTLGPLPDMAERKSLEYLQEILNEIKKVYSPGTTLLIYCDGIPFAEFFGIPAKDVIAYEEALQLLIADLPDISVYTSKDILKTYGLKSTFQITEFLDHYEPSDKQFKAELKSIPSTALKRFALELDHPQGRLVEQKNTLEDIAIRLLAREMRLRTYIAKAFPSTDFFRLTVHLSIDVSKKFGIRLSPNSDITPYHGVLVQGLNGTWSIHFKKDVDIHNHILKYEIINGVKCGYFKQAK